MAEAIPAHGEVMGASWGPDPRATVPGCRDPSVVAEARAEDAEDPGGIVP